MIAVRRSHRHQASQLDVTGGLCVDFLGAKGRDLLAHEREALLDLVDHLNATIAPNRVPSGSRRCDGRNGVSFVQSPSTCTSLTPVSSSWARFAAARSRRNRSSLPGLT